MTTTDDTYRGPWVAAAVLAERVLIEQDGAVSLIRMIDRITVKAHGPEPPDNLPQAQVRINLYLLIRGGDARGRVMVTIRRESPSGISNEVGALPVYLEPGNRGEGVQLDLTMAVEQEGLYWFDVLVEQTLLTRIPLEIRYEPLRQVRLADGG